MCAAKELQIMGVRISTEYLDALRRAAAGRSKHRRDTTEANAADVEPTWNREFAYVAGHTAAGLPFGVTWEEMEGLEGDDVPFTADELEPGKFCGVAGKAWGLNWASVSAVDSRPLMGRAFTKLQGQYLAFIAMYTKLHRRPPAEADIQAYFQVTPPSVHNMIVTLERRGLVSKSPGTPRSIRVLVAAEQLPALD
jgi:hypothetical protein